MQPKKQNSSIFVNHKGVLCCTVILFGKEVLTCIDVEPMFDGYDINGNIINANDWNWVSKKQNT